MIRFPNTGKGKFSRDNANKVRVCDILQQLKTVKQMAGTIIREIEAEKSKLRDQKALANAMWTE